MILNKAIIKKIMLDPKAYANKSTADDLATILAKLSDAYYNGSTPLVSDAIFDELKDALIKKDPTHTFLKRIGAPIKGTKEKKKLPFEMGSLSKIKADGPDTDLTKFTQKYPGPYITSDKLDGASLQFYKDPAGKIHLFSRGDGTTGQDVTHLLKFITHSTDQIPPGTSIRGELIISKKNFQTIANKMKNARNAISGLINSKTVDLDVASIASFVTYAILSPRYKQHEQLSLLEKWGFNVVPYKKTSTITKSSLQITLTERKKQSEYEIDGIVITDDSKIYPHMGGYPDHSFAFKMVDENETATTTIEEVLWEPSMDAYLKPTIKIKPVQLSGTTVTYATAFNAKYIQDNKIGPGVIIKITRSGDVIPYILEVTKPAPAPQMPPYPYKWNATGIDIILTNIEGKVKQIVTSKILQHFFSTLGTKYISGGIIDKLIENGFDTIPKILDANQTELSKIPGLGTKGVTKIYAEIDKSFKTTDLPTFMAASHKFGRGLAQKKLAEIVKKYPLILTQNWSTKEMIKNIEKVSGFSNKLATMFTENFQTFMKFYKEIAKIKDLSRFELGSDSDDDDDDSDDNSDDNSDDDSNDDSNDDDDNNKNKNKNKKQKPLTGQKIVFTGFRPEKEFQKKLEKMGAQISNSVSSNTTLLVHKDGADTTSSKFTKAQKLGTQVLSNSQFLDKYKLTS